MGNPLSLFLTKSVNSWSTVTTSVTGISTTDLAILVSTFWTSIISFIDTPKFFLVCPSILTASGFFSSSSIGQTIAQLNLFPFNWIISPGATCRKSIASGPILALFLPTSLCFASPMHICNDSLFWGNKFTYFISTDILLILRTSNSLTPSTDRIPFSK